MCYYIQVPTFDKSINTTISILFNTINGISCVCYFLWRVPSSPIQCTPQYYIPTMITLLMFLKTTNFKEGKYN